MGNKGFVFLVSTFSKWWAYVGQAGWLAAAGWGKCLKYWRAWVMSTPDRGDEPPNAHDSPAGDFGSAYIQMSKRVPFVLLTKGP